MKFPLLKLDIAHLGSYITAVVSRWISGKKICWKLCIWFTIFIVRIMLIMKWCSLEQIAVFFGNFINFAWSVLRVLDMFVIPWGQGNYCLWKNVNFKCQDIFQSSISSLHIDANMSKKFMKLNGGGVWTKTDLLP